MKSITIKIHSRKTYQCEGKWIERPSPTVIFLCACGNKYIKTRLNQAVCVRCISKKGTAV